jgi:hypothetical protein
LSGTYDRTILSRKERRSSHQINLKQYISLSKRGIISKRKNKCSRKIYNISVFPFSVIYSWEIDTIIMPPKHCKGPNVYGQKRRWKETSAPCLARQDDNLLFVTREMLNEPGMFEQLVFGTFNSVLCITRDEL